MRLLRRRLTLQLTPLLDLLLIVIFAQYMEMRQQTVEAASVAAERVEAAEQERAAARRELERELADLQQMRRRLTEDEQRLVERARQAEEQRRVAGEVASELFRIPEDLMRRVFAPTDSPGSAPSPAETEKLREELRAIGRLRGEELIRHLLTYHELRKRADVWDLYIAETGVITLDADGQTFRFRARSADEFATELFGRYKNLPQPKGLVIILLSYGNVTEVQAQEAATGLRLAAERMRRDSGTRTQFEYAILGLRPRDDSRQPAAGE